MQINPVWVPARELLLPDRQRCPAYPLLSLDGLAIDTHDRPHLIISTPTARTYLGPDTATVTG